MRTAGRLSAAYPSAADHNHRALCSLRSLQPSLALMIVGAVPFSADALAALRDRGACLRLFAGDSIVRRRGPEVVPISAEIGMQELG